jgi:hypothetical protein
MILSPEKLAVIAQAAAEVQRRVYYERERWQPKEHDIGDQLARRELALIQAVIRELVALGWIPPDVLFSELVHAMVIGTGRTGQKPEDFARERIAELTQQPTPAPKPKRPK